jgi:hypothetical protein
MSAIKTNSFFVFGIVGYPNSLPLWRAGNSKLGVLAGNVSVPISGYPEFSPKNGSHSPQNGGTISPIFFFTNANLFMYRHLVKYFEIPCLLTGKRLSPRCFIITLFSTIRTTWKSEFFPAVSEFHLAD